MPVTRMQQKRGTAAEWASTNPVLADGEIGFERDTGTIKVGNGYDTWANLVPILRSVLAPTEAEWNANTRILAQGEVAIARDTQVIKVGNGTQTWSALPSVLASTFVGTKGGDTIVASSATVVPLRLKAAPSQSASMLEILDASGAVSTALNAAGVPYRGGSWVFNNEASENARFVASAATKLALVVRGAASQSANLAEFQNNAGSVKSFVNSYGSLTVSNVGRMNAPDDPAGGAGTDLFSPAATRVALMVRAAASQSVNILEIQNSAGSVIAAVNSAGGLYSSSLIDSLGGLRTNRFRTNGQLRNAAQGGQAGLLEVFIDGTAYSIPFFF